MGEKERGTDMIHTAQGSEAPSDAGAERASNLNLSKTNRETAPGDDDQPEPAAINNSHSNIKGREAAPGDNPDPAGINNSKSNIKDRQAAPDDDPDETRINNTKSNIKNREAPGGEGIAVADEGFPADKPSSTTN